MYRSVKTVEFAKYLQDDAFKFEKLFLELFFPTGCDSVKYSFEIEMIPTRIVQHKPHERQC